MLDVQRVMKELLAASRRLIERRVGAVEAKVETVIAGFDAERAAAHQFIARMQAEAAEARERSRVERAALQAEIAELRGRLDGLRLPEVIAGKDGASVVDARTNDDGELILKMSTGETMNAGRIVGRDGTDGNDGLGIEDLSIDYDGDRGLVLRMQAGEIEKRAELTLPIPIYRDVWREGTYQKGDCVTWAGSVWIAQHDTDARPAETHVGDKAQAPWRLAVKRGRDAKAPVKAVRE